VLRHCAYLIVVFVSAGTALGCDGSPKKSQEGPDGGAGTDIMADIGADTGTEFDSSGLHHIYWVQTAGVPGVHSEGYGVAARDDGSIAVTGQMHSEVGRFFLALYSPDGLLRWVARGVPDMHNIRGRDVAIAANGDILVIGEFYDDVTLGWGEAEETLLDGDAPWSVFVARYDHDGTLLWAKAAGAPEGDDLGGGVAAGSSDAVLVTGSFSGDFSMGLGEPHETLLQTTGNDDMFVAKLDGATGNLVWVSRAFGKGDDRGSEVVALGDGSSVVTGSFGKGNDSALLATVFGQDEDGETTLLTDGARAVFLARYSGDGTLVWATENSDSSYGELESGDDLALMTGGKVLVSGTYENLGAFGEVELPYFPGSSLFLVEYDLEGDALWGSAAGGDGTACGLGLDRDQDGSIALTGFFSGSIEFGGGETNATTFYDYEECSAYIARYAPDGTLEWASRLMSTDYCESHALALTPDGGLAVTGACRSASIFGVDENDEPVSFDATYDYFFLAKYDWNWAPES